MAIYSFSVKPISRLNGESIVKVATYQSRGRLYDEREKIQYDFTHKTDLLYTNIFLPSNAPFEFSDRQKLWSAVDKAEKRFDARTGRAVIAALPNELNLDEQIRMVNKFVIEAFITNGMCADIAIHNGQRKNKSQIDIHDAKIYPNNPHIHILLTDRPVNKNGFCTKKNRDWNNRLYIHKWRELWEKVQNHELKEKGLSVRVSHESLEVQGINREPTKHLGRKATEMKRRGKKTDRDNENCAIENRNKALNKYRLKKEQENEFELSR